MRKVAAIALSVACVLAPARYALAAEADTDGDGITDLAEISMYATDPSNPDTDGDGFADGEEVAHGYSPRHGQGKRHVEVDSDRDYLPDAWELELGTGLLNPDTDGDGYLDGTEVRAGYDPRDPSPQAKLGKLIRVDLPRQQLTYSLGGVALESFPISSGLPRTPTPVGEFSVLSKVPVKHYVGPNFDYPNTRWNLHFATKTLRYYIHGAYWHNDFGNPRSSGCVNVSYRDMERLYQWAQVGTRVVITS